MFVMRGTDNPCISDRNEVLHSPSGVASRPWGWHTLIWVTLCGALISSACGKSTAPTMANSSRAQAVISSAQPGSKDPATSSQQARLDDFQEDFKPIATRLPPHGTNSGRVTSQRGAANEDESKETVRPKDITVWQPDNFSSAKVEGDERLIEAVSYVIRERHDDAEAIQMLIGLLKIDPPEESEKDDSQTGAQNRSRSPFPGDLMFGEFELPGGRGGQPAPERYRYVSPDVAAVIVEGLGLSNTSEAMAAVKGLLMGDQSAPLLKQDLVASAITALATNVNAEKEDVLFDLLTQPEAVAPATFEEDNPRSAFRRGARGNTRRPESPHRGRNQSRRDIAFDDFDLPGEFLGDVGLHRSRNTRTQRRRSRPPRDKNELDEAWIQDEVLHQAGRKLSRKFRNRLAKYLNNPNVLLETAQLFEEYLVEDDPRNDAAQILLVKNLHTETETRDYLEGIFVQRSSEAVRKMLALPESSLTQSRSRSRHNRGPLNHLEFGLDLPMRQTRDRLNPSRKPTRSSRSSRKSRREFEADKQFEVEVRERVDPQQRFHQQLRLLWSSQAIGMLHSTHRENADHQIDSRIPLLFATIPLSQSRVALNDIFADSKGKGPDLWVEMGMFGTTTLDPAVLIMAKPMYHGSPSSRRTISRSPNEFGGRSSENPVDRWSELIEPYVVDLCERFQQAAFDQDDNEDNSVARAVKLPVRPHKGAKLVAQFDVRWPDALTKPWNSYAVAPIEIHYRRFEEEGTANLLVHHYRHRNKDGREQKIDHGVWLDKFDEEKQLSIDVLITATNGDLGIQVGDGRTNNRPQRPSRDRGRRSLNSGRGRTTVERKSLVIEILTVGIPSSEQETDRT